MIPTAKSELTAGLEASELRHRVGDVVRRLKSAAHAAAADLTRSGTPAAVQTVQRQPGRSPYLIPTEAFLLEVPGRGVVAIGWESRFSADVTNASVPVIVAPVRGVPRALGIVVTSDGLRLPDGTTTPVSALDADALVRSFLELTGIER